MSTLSVVVVNYNTRDLLRNCLAALQASTQPAQIIVVDNASSDGSATMVADVFPGVDLLALDENTWFTGGNNHGIRAATGDYVLLLNPDTVVAPDALARLVAFMDAHPDYAGATGQLHYPDGEIQRTCSRIPTFAYLLAAHTPLGTLAHKWRARLYAHHWYTGADFTRQQDYDVQVMPGSCLLMRRGDIWLNEDLLLYYPEDDLAQRFAGRKFRFVADARITHHEKSATNNWGASRIYFRDLLIYVRQHHGPAHMLLMWVLTRPLWLAMWLRARLR